MEIRQVHDYIDMVHEKFPELTRKDVEKILNYGFRSYYMNSYYGIDILIRDKWFLAYCGKIYKNVFRLRKYQILKNRIKCRVNYRREKIKFDGYYYIGMWESQFQKLLNSNGHCKKWNPKQMEWFISPKVILRKILDEALFEKYDYIFSIYIGVDLGYSSFKEKFRTNKLKMIYKKVDGQFIKVENNG